MATINSFADRLKHARKNIAGITQKQLSDKAGVKQPVISALENGEQSSTASVVEIADALGVSIHWLKSGKGEPLVSEAPSFEVTLKNNELNKSLERFSKLAALVEKFNLTDDEISEVERAAVDKAQDLFLNK